MPTQKQAPIVLKKRMLDKRVSVTALAKKLGHARSTVSRAINQGSNAGVLAKVKEALSV